MMVKNHMAQTLKAATTFIEQGRILWFSNNIVIEGEEWPHLVNPLAQMVEHWFLN